MNQGLLTQSEEPIQNTVANGNDKNPNTAVADGGNVTADEAFTDDEIRSAINSRSCLASIAEIRDVLQTVQQRFEEFWAAHMDGVHQGTLDLVETDNSILIFADNTGQFWNEEFGHPPLADRNLSERTPKVIKRLHHTWARRHTNYGWSTVDPVVIRKPQNFKHTQMFIESVVNGLIDKGLSPGQAWAVYGVHVAGNSRNKWASKCGYADHSAVSEPLRKAENKLDRTALLH
ncbi:hypothetical protein [Halorubrum yunnanense]|uniref:Uncharacterized protein n=1 Tax=Halorubrum yunnanense TaxID=1526162 RepID=A0ABD5YP54_9EURY|nr:hypothetical protein [Halorubrum yunnanense]